MNVDLLIKNGIIVTMNAERGIIDGGTVAIVKDKIIDIGLNSELEGKYAASKVIDASKKVVLPGLINCHSHSGMSIFRGVGDDLNLMDAHHRIYDPLIWGPEVLAEDVYIGSLLSCIDYIKSGQTCIVNHYPKSAEVAKAFERAGLRAVLAEFTQDTWLGEVGAGNIPRSMKNKETVLKEVINFIELWNGKANGRIRCCFGPTHELMASRELLKDIAKLSKEYKVDIHMLLAETIGQVNTILQLYGKRSVEYIAELGILGPHTHLGHCCWLSPGDIKLLAQSGTTVVTTPVCEMKISDGITPVPMLLQSGVNVALGTDAAGQCTGTNDLIREMKTLALLHKVNYPLDPGVITAETVLEMVTVNGAKALGWEEEIGSLEKGKKADIVMLDLNKSHLTPLLRKPKLNVVSLLVYSAVGGDIDTMIVDGKIIMLNNQILTLNENQIIEEVQIAAEKLLERSKVAEQEFPWNWKLYSQNNKFTYR